MVVAAVCSESFSNSGAALSYCLFHNMRVRFFPAFVRLGGWRDSRSAHSCKPAPHPRSCAGTGSIPLFSPGCTQPNAPYFCISNKPAGKAARLRHISWPQTFSRLGKFPGAFIKSEGQPSQGQQACKHANWNNHYSLHNRIILLALFDNIARKAFHFFYV